MAQEPGKKRAPEEDPKDLERLRNLEKDLDAIMESDAFRGVVAEAAKEARALSELKANPKALLQRKGIRIPEGVEVRITEESPWCFCWYYSHWHRYCYCC